MTALATRDRHYCSSCQKRYATRGMCSVHPREALVDLGDPDARRVLADTDRIARLTQTGKVAAISLLVSVPLASVSAMVSTQWAAAGALVGYALVTVGQLGLIAVVALLSVMIFRRKPALALEENEIAALEAARLAEEGGSGRQ